MQTFACFFALATIAAFSGQVFSYDALQDDIANEASGLNFGDSKMHLALNAVGAGASAGASSDANGRLGYAGSGATAASTAGAGAKGHGSAGVTAGAGAGSSSN